jgi:hypothetical protein
MKYRLEGTIIEEIDGYVRITLGNGAIRVTKRQYPKPIEVANLLREMQGHEPNNAQLQACSRSANEAITEKMETDKYWEEIINGNAARPKLGGGGS